MGQSAGSSRPCGAHLGLLNAPSFPPPGLPGARSAPRAPPAAAMTTTPQPTTPRRSREPGHRRKFLVVVDDTPECDRAIYYAARRAAGTQGGLVLLGVLELEGVAQQWLGVADLMRAEAHEEMEARLQKFAARARQVAGITPDLVVKEGAPAEAIARLIADCLLYTSDAADE